ncbi:uncharacterized protein TNCV_3751341 [Trichonephila clavipes]|uniref:Uncharacterized protein n=1 Tax=Trichonephila clavipes TaxID=2585209 RepID=A0A8X6R1Y4_TRICX|nr:uncharacterized protein TNCV_3751341 [Trichonephila clavipes]
MNDMGPQTCGTTVPLTGSPCLKRGSRKNIDTGLRYASAYHYTPSFLIQSKEGTRSSRFKQSDFFQAINKSLKYVPAAQPENIIKPLYTKLTSSNKASNFRLFKACDDMKLTIFVTKVTTLSRDVKPLFARKARW